MRRREQTDKTFFEGNVDLPQLAASLNKIFKTVDKDGLGQETFTELEKEIQTVSSKLGVSKKAAILLGYIVEHSATSGSDDDDLANYVGCSNIEFIGFRSSIEELDNHGVITHIQRGPAHRLCYYVTREALKTIEKDAEFIPFPMTGLSADELFTRFRIFFSDFLKDIIDAERLLANIHQVLKGNPDLEFSKKVLDSPLMTECCDTEERFFFYLCHRMVSFGDNSVPIERLLSFTDYMEDDQLIRRSLSNERSTLQKSGLVCFGGEDGFQDMDSLALSDDVINAYVQALGEGLDGIIAGKEPAEIPLPKMLPASMYQSFQAAIKQAATPWFRYFLQVNPSTVLGKIACPVLAIGGKKDLQVNSTQHLGLLEGGLHGKGHKIVNLPTLNHLLQHCQKGTIEEYGEIEETISPEALQIMTDWVKEQ